MLGLLLPSFCPVSLDPSALDIFYGHDDYSVPVQRIWQLCCVNADLQGVVFHKLPGLGGTPAAAFSRSLLQTYLILPHFPTESKIFFLADVMAGKALPLLRCAQAVLTLQTHNSVYMDAP